MRIALKISKPSREMFFLSVFRKKKRVLALADLPASPPPCDLSQGLRYELSGWQQPEARRLSAA
jgi:hypothetical protein